MPTSGTEEGGPHPAKKTRRSDNAFLRAWAWKREHRPDKVRFERPYSHTVSLPGCGGVTLIIRQRRFKELGFASTVWDSSIVLAKFFEWQGEDGMRERFRGAATPRRVLDLSAGCGLVACVLSLLGADVTASDLRPNLPLIRENCELNGRSGVEVAEHTWGADASALGQFDVVAACDVMYICEAVPALVASLAALCAPGGCAYVAHGRNRRAEPAFQAAIAGLFCLEVLGPGELHPDYQSDDISVWRLTRTTGGAEAPGRGRLS